MTVEKILAELNANVGDPSCDDAVQDVMYKYLGAAGIPAPEVVRDAVEALRQFGREDIADELEQDLL